MATDDRKIFLEALRNTLRKTGKTIGEKVTNTVEDVKTGAQVIGGAVKERGGDVLSSLRNERDKLRNTMVKVGLAAPDAETYREEFEQTWTQKMPEKPRQYEKFSDEDFKNLAFQQFVMEKDVERGGIPRIPGTNTTFDFGVGSLEKIGGKTLSKITPVIRSFTEDAKNELLNFFSKAKDKGAIGERLQEIGIKLSKKEGDEVADALARTTQPEEVKAILESPVGKLTEAVKQAKPGREVLEQAYTTERGKRATAGAAEFETGEGEKAYFNALKKMKGELAPDAKNFEGVRGQLDETEVNALFTQVQRNPQLDFYDKINTQTALTNILEGKIPPKNQLKLLEDTFGRDLVEEVLNKRTTGEKARELVTSVINIPRAIMSSMDFSAPLRQGIVFSVTKPGKALSAGKEMFKQAFSPENYNKWMTDLRNDEIYPLMRKSKLYIADANRIAGGLDEREEAFMSNLAEKIPLVGKMVKASERAYTAFLNKMRADVFRDLASKFQEQGITSQKVYDDLAEYINTATGRGNLGKFEKYAQDLNSVFFSPRYAAARLNMLNPVWYVNKSAPVRKEAVKSMAQFVGTMATLLGLATLAPGIEVESDPKSTDFGKVKSGNTRWDLLGGFQQWIRFFTQFTSGKRRATGSGNVTDADRSETLGRFVRGKLAPIPSLAMDLIKGETVVGEEVTIPKAVSERFLPLVTQDIKDILEEEGPLGLLTGAVPAMFGVGVQTFEAQRGGERSRPANKATEARRRSIERRRRELNRRR